MSVVLSVFITVAKADFAFVVGLWEEGVFPVLILVFFSSLFFFSLAAF